MAVIVFDKENNPLHSCTEKRARLLLEKGRAKVLNITPFTIQILDHTVADYVTRSNNSSNLIGVGNAEHHT